MARKRIVEDIRRKMGSEEVMDKLSRTFSVMGDANRARIIFALSQAELCVEELSILLEMRHSAVSHQLRSLKDLDLVRCRKEGRRAYYKLNDEHIENLFNEGLIHVMERLKE